MNSDLHTKPNQAAENYLPFTVGVATTDELPEVARLRASAYGKHLPDLGASLRFPEAADFELGCEVLVARSKFDGSLLGTLRTHANVLVPIPLEASIALPGRFEGTRMVEATRLCVLGSNHASLVRTALFKALHQYCLLQDANWMMAAGRRPIDRIYESLLFKDVEAPNRFYPMAHAGGIAHRVMSMPANGLQMIWKANKHPLYHFGFETYHPDISLDGVKSLQEHWGAPKSTPMESVRQFQSIAQELMAGPERLGH
jgi:hypothetical protein